MALKKYDSSVISNQEIKIIIEHKMKNAVERWANSFMLPTKY